jgi:uncharacterized membrane protein YfcA
MTLVIIFFTTFFSALLSSMSGGGTNAINFPIFLLSQANYWQNLID